MVDEQIQARRLTAQRCHEVDGTDPLLGLAILVALRDWGTASGLPNANEDPTQNVQAAMQCIPADYRLEGLHDAGSGEFAKDDKRPWSCILRRRRPDENDSFRVEVMFFDAATAALAICGACLLIAHEEALSREHA